MAREWKPGDVGMVNDTTGLTPDQPATCIKAAVPGEREAEWLLHGSGARVWSSVSRVRPLVVIDPESREQVAQLTGALVYSGTQAALRSLANPTSPKPEEPLGLGAVVEDENGNHWVRIGDDLPESPPWRRRGSTARTYLHIAAIKVHSEGVTP